MREELIADQIKISSNWKLLMLLWHGLHFALGIAAILLSVTVAGKPFHQWSADYYEHLAWLLALTTGLITFLHPEQRSDRYGRAWSILNSTITLFKADASYSVKRVVEAYDRGEEIIRQA